MKNKIFITLTFLASVFILSSCLKDNQGEDWTASLKGKMYAEIWNAGFTTMALQPVPDTVEFKFLVNIATDALPTQDITLTFGIDTNVMKEFNTLKGTNYKLYPYINIVDKQLVIKAGTRNAYAHVQVWHADTLNACDNFMAPVAIKTATGGVVVADPLNQGARLMGLPISNPWAGDYHCVGYRLHPSLGVLPVDKTETMSTINCSTVQVSGFGDYPYNIIINVTTNTMLVGAPINHTVFLCNLTIIDPGTGLPVGSGQGQFATYSGAPASPPIPLTNDVNYYDPVIKRFVLNAWYNSAANRIMYEWLDRE